MRLDIPVLITLTIAAAALQSVLSLPPWMVIKPPLLTAIAAYYALSRELPLALTAALWCGALADLSGGFPLTVTTPFVLLLSIGLRSLRRYAGVFFYWRGLLVMAFAAVLQAIWYGAAAGLGGMPLTAFIRTLTGTAAGGAVVGWIMFFICDRFDRLAGNVKGVEPEDGAAWHITNL
ncbi:MAG: hypothetical protein GX230_11040 [Lentisphaerae bacterium]|nr:hypothetical protein [Lentisphaerota bacterium]